MAAETLSTVFGEAVQSPSTPLDTYEVIEMLSFVEALKLHEGSTEFWEAERCCGQLAHHFLWHHNAFGGLKALFVELLSKICLAVLNTGTKRNRQGYRALLKGSPFVLDSVHFFRALYLQRQEDVQCTWLPLVVRVILQAMNPRFKIASDIERDLSCFTSEIAVNRECFHAFANQFDLLCDTLVISHKWHRPVLLAAVQHMITMDREVLFGTRLATLVDTVQRLADIGVEASDMVVCLKHWIAGKLSIDVEDSEC